MANGKGNNPCGWLRTEELFISYPGGYVTRQSPLFLAMDARNMGLNGKEELRDFEDVRQEANVLQVKPIDRDYPHVKIFKWF